MNTIRADARGFAVVLPARFTEIDLVCREVESFLAGQELSRLAFVVLLGVREALTNAIRHGSTLDPAKEISFAMERRGEALLLKVGDQGPGFDWRRCAAAPPLCSAESGRGLAILRQYFDGVRFNDAGNELELEIRIERGCCHV